MPPARKPGPKSAMTNKPGSGSQNVSRLLRFNHDQFLSLFCAYIVMIKLVDLNHVIVTLLFCINCAIVGSSVSPALRHLLYRFICLNFKSLRFLSHDSFG
jgi:hypothetical protein